MSINLKTIISISFVFSFILCIAVPLEKGSGIVLSNDFENQKDGWVSSSKGIVKITHDKANVHSGSGALEYKYTVRKEAMEALFTPIEDNLTHAKIIKFWVKTDGPTMLGVLLNEKTIDGKDRSFHVLVNSSGKAWQPVSIPISDFIIDEKDPNPYLKPTLKNIAGVGIIDALAFLSLSDDHVSEMFGDRSGKEHTMWIDDFLICSKTDTPARSANIIDDFKRDYISWISSSPVSLSNDVSRGVLNVSYYRSDETPFFFVRPVGPEPFKGGSSISFKARANKKSMLYMQCETTTGGKYNHEVTMPESSEFSRYSFNFSDFKPADDNHDSEKKFNPEKIKLVLFIDLSNALDPDARKALITLNLSDLKVN